MPLKIAMILICFKKSKAIKLFVRVYSRKIKPRLVWR